MNDKFSILGQGGCNVTILEGAEVRLELYSRGGCILQGDTPEGAEGQEGWTLG